MPGKSAEMNHVLVYVDDVEKAARFYSDLLDLKVITKMDGYARLVSPKTKTTLGLHGRMEHAADRKRRKSGDVRLYFEVADLDGVCRRLRAKKVKFTQGPKDMPWGWRHAYLNDPDGHEVSLYTAGARRLKSG